MHADMIRSLTEFVPGTTGAIVVDRDAGESLPHAPKVMSAANSTAIEQFLPTRVMIAVFTDSLHS